MQDLTLEMVAHHPHLVIMHDDSSGDSRGTNIDGFAMMEKPMTGDIGRVLVELWILRKNMKIQFHKVAVVDTSERKMFMVDYLVEAGNTPLFVVWYSSERRRQERRAMQNYAEMLSNASERAFGQRVGIVLVNMYHTGVEGGLT